MSGMITIELKSDLESIYKITGDLLNRLESMNFDKESREIKRLMGHIKFELEDIGGTLQKDIFNCDYILTKIKTQDTEYADDLYISEIH